MKKVLFIMHSMPVGGAEKVLVDIFDNIDFNEYNVDLLLYNNEGEMLSRISENVNIYYVFGPSKTNLLYRLKYKFLYIFHLISWWENRHLKKVKISQYDCIVSFCQGAAHKLHTFLLKNAPLHVSWIHSDLSLENWGKLFFDKSIKKQECAYNKMDRLVFVSKGAKDAFNRTFKINNNVDQRVIYNIVDVNKIRSLATDFTITKPHNKFLFLNSGRLVSPKKQIRLVEAARILKEKGYIFEIWILGEGPLRGEIQARISKYDLDNFVRLLGVKGNPYPYYKIADAFVLSSSQEGFSLVVCEAMSLGVPIVSTHVVGPTEILGEDSLYGLLVGESDEEIAGGLIKMMDSRSLRHNYSLKAIERSKLLDKSIAMSEIYKVLS